MLKTTPRLEPNLRVKDLPSRGKFMLRIGVDAHERSWRAVSCLIGTVLLNSGLMIAASGDMESFAGRAPIRYLPAQKLWILETNRTSYVVGLNELNELQHVYWGKKIFRDQDFVTAHTHETFPFESPEGITNEEYPGWGGMRYLEPCLKVKFASGVRDVVLKYVSHEIKHNSLEVHMKDIWGVPDVFVEVQAADPKGLNELVIGRIQQLEGVERTETHITFD
jgi:Glycosyl hydrolase family 36 N-terminal domain/Lrp/AsnC ligand binding domain